MITLSLSLWSVWGEWDEASGGRDHKYMILHELQVLLRVLQRDTMRHMSPRVAIPQLFGKGCETDLQLVSLRIPGSCNSRLWKGIYSA
jgi:hypothetical protein